MNDRQKQLVARARRATKQEYRDECGKWIGFEGMPRKTYFDTLSKWEPENLIVEEDPEGRVIIDRIEREGDKIGYLGSKTLVARHDLHDRRRFSEFKE